MNKINTVNFTMVTLDVSIVREDGYAVQASKKAKLKEVWINPADLSYVTSEELLIEGVDSKFTRIYFKDGKPSIVVVGDPQHVQSKFVHMPRKKVLKG